MPSEWKLVLNGLKATNSAFTPPVPNYHPDSSKGIMTEIATEVYELIMDHLSDDARTLLACNLVCRAWHPRSHHLLLRLMACRPRALSGIVHGGHGTIHCAVPYLQGGVIYGATDGVYLGTENGSRRRLASLRNVVRIAIFQDVNLFLCIADSDLISMPLRPLISAQTNVTRISKHVVYVSVHRSSTPGEHHRVCALKSSALSGTIKVFDVIGDQHGARLAVARELYIPIQLTSIRFLSRDRIAAALKQTFPGQSGFEVLDLLSAHTQSLLDPDDPNLVFAFNKDAVGRAITMFRVAGIFLVCNEKLGFFIDRRGRLAIDFPIFKWKETPSAFIVHEPYLLAFANQRIEVWNLETAEMVQKVPGPYIPLNMAESGDQILTLDLFSKEVTEIEFLNQK